MKAPWRAAEFTSEMLDHDQAEPASDCTATVSDQGPTQAIGDERSSWTLKCSQPDGKQHSLEQVQVARGERAEVGDTCHEDKAGEGTLLRWSRGAAWAGGPRAARPTRRLAAGRR